MALEDMGFAVSYMDSILGMIATEYLESPPWSDEIGGWAYSRMTVFLKESEGGSLVVAEYVIKPDPSRWVEPMRMTYQSAKAVYELLFDKISKYLEPNP